MMITKRFLMFLNLLLLITCASCESSSDFVVLSTDYGPQDNCKSNLYVDLNTVKHKFDGKQGADGIKGLKGDRGMRGLEGSPGEGGRDGIDGKDGAPGTSGPRGEVGDQGPRGVDGANARTGIKGPQGPRGDSGIPGSPGKCSCEFDDDEITLIPEWGKTRGKPGLVTCRNAPIDKSGTYYIFKKPIEVYCDIGTKKTCIHFNSSKVINYTQSEPFWLSQKNVSLKDIYNLESDQLSWLQRNSFSAYLNIRYHCLNSNPFGEGSNEMILLSWNDKKIGRKSTSSSPFHYHIPSATDSCSKAKTNEWSFTDIQLVSPIVQRLPIRDFLITDVKNEYQALRIEILELCFG